MEPRPRVLVAGTRLGIAAVRQVLDEHAELVGAQSVEEALTEVERGVRLIICNVRFDDSRMFDFLGALAGRPAARGIPVVCCRVRHRPLSAGARRAIALALEALGVAEFVDMQAIEEEQGQEAAREALRRAALSRLERSG
ncbi:MAG TPA: hypothetical protein VHG88_06755 [Burkholderiales bacterium]|nr:hypothetical protein [Burkholderiales bacterium]